MSGNVVHGGVSREERGVAEDHGSARDKAGAERETRSGWAPAMAPVVAERLRAALAARPRALLTDVDGTISAIAPTPEAATLLPGIAGLLTDAADVFDLVAAISGRAALDARRLVGLGHLLYIGNHGLEQVAPRNQTADDTRDDPSLAPEVHPDAQPYSALVTAALDDVARDVVPSYPGVRVERKGVTGSIHFRLAAQPEAAQRAVLDRLLRTPAWGTLRVTQGKQVIELRPPVAMHKGTAVERLITEHGLRGAIYLGDDRTDIDAFQALRERTTREESHQGFHGFAVAVLSAEAPAGLAPAADLALPSIEQVPGFLAWLLATARADAAHRSSGH